MQTRQTSQEADRDRERSTSYRRIALGLTDQNVTRSRSRGTFYCSDIKPLMLESASTTINRSDPKVSVERPRRPIQSFRAHTEENPFMNHYSKIGKLKLSVEAKIKEGNQVPGLSAYPQKSSQMLCASNTERASCFGRIDSKDSTRVPLFGPSHSEFSPSRNHKSVLERLVEISQTFDGCYAKGPNSRVEKIKLKIIDVLDVGNKAKSLAQMSQADSLKFKEASLRSTRFSSQLRNSKISMKLLEPNLNYHRMTGRIHPIRLGEHTAPLSDLTSRSREPVSDSRIQEDYPRETILKSRKNISSIINSQLEFPKGEETLVSNRDACTVIPSTSKTFTDSQKPIRKLPLKLKPNEFVRKVALAIGARASSNQIASS